MEELMRSELKIENMIYEIRGKQVMLDSDLAKLYQCKGGTKVINQAVSRNIERFPKDFYFQLSLKEYREFLKSQFVTSNEKSVDRGGVRKLPYVFTEQGVAMLATVLKTEVASQVSVNIMRAFVAMRRYLSTGYLDNQIINNQVVRNSNDIIEIKEKIKENTKDIKLLQESFKKFEEKKVVNEIYFNGQIYDAYSKILDIFKEAKNEIIVVDGYADKVFLDIARNIKVSIKLITFTQNTKFQSLYSKYSKQYSNLKVTYNNSFHDRYFILDQITVYHCGTSISYAGSKTFSINRIEDRVVIDALIKTIYSLI